MNLKEKLKLHIAWENCNQPGWLLWVLDELDLNVQYERELRLFACGCVRYTPLGDGRVVWDLLTDPRSKRAIEVVEELAIGKANQEKSAALRSELEQVRADAADASKAAARVARAARVVCAAVHAAAAAALIAVHADSAARTATSTVSAVAHAVGATCAGHAAWVDAKAAQATELKRLIGNPFLKELS